MASPHAGGAARDDTELLQARLDAGGTVFLPKLQDGGCYRTRGLWVSRDGTSISSDGACIVAIGPGAGRIKRGDGTLVRANAVFFLNHSSIFDPLPVRVSISGLRITVPASTRMAGVSVFGHEVALSHLTIGGAPTTDVLIGGGEPGAGGMTGRIAVTDCNLSGGKRDVISAFGPVGLRIERNTLSGARGLPRGQSAAGLVVRSADRGQPTLDVHVVGNRIVGNAGPGILFDLDPRNGPPVLASGIEITDNRILRNAGRASPQRRGGIVLVGGQDGGEGRLALTQNIVRGNRGPGILGRNLRLVLSRGRNDLRGNGGGPLRGIHVAAERRPAEGAPSLPPASAATGAGRDDTKWLQARLDARGGTVLLPKLPNGECYATRGLWVSRDDTRITSDGACIVSLGPGEVRLRSIDGDPIGSSAVFFVNRSRASRPAPVRVTIENLRIFVPDGQPMFGVAIFGHDVTLSHLDVAGGPKDDVLIGGRANGNGYVANVAVLDSTLGGASRNAISAFGVIGLRIEGNTIVGVRDSPPGQPAAGIDVEPDDRGQPTFGVRIARNTIRDNAGPGILLSLDSNSGPAVLASDLEIRGNTIIRNSAKRTPPTRAGVVLSGGQDGGEGKLVLADNLIHDNGGPGILTVNLKLEVQASGNDIAGNESLTRSLVPRQGR